MLKIVLIGGGNVAHHLFSQFQNNPETQLVQWYNRTIEAIQEFENHTDITDSLMNLKQADLYILAVSDNAITEVSESLPFENRLVVHTSGNTSMYALDPKNRGGVFYPLQSFSKHRSIDWTQLPLLVEAAQLEDQELLERLAKSLTDKIYALNSKQRKSVHLIAVFVNNFVNHMFSIGATLCKQEQIPFEVFLPLIKETTDKLDKMDPTKSQTGPAIRGDYQTIESHLELLKNEQFKDIYKTITTSILKTYGREKL